MKFTKYLFVFVLIYFAVSVQYGSMKTGGENIHGNMVLEMEQTFNFSKKIVELDGESFLKISGLSGHSAFSVVSFEIIYHRESVQILIHLTSSNTEGLSGSFEELVKIPKSKKEIVFGLEKNLIWDI